MHFLLLHIKDCLICIVLFPLCFILKRKVLKLRFQPKLYRMEFNPKLYPRIITAIFQSNYRYSCRKLCFFQGSTAPVKKRATRGSQSKKDTVYTIQKYRNCKNLFVTIYFLCVNPEPLLIRHFCF